MRWLFVGVIALNLLYFGWRLATPDAQAPQAVEDASARAFPAPLELVADTTTMTAPPQTGIVAGCPAVGPWASADEAGLAAKAISSGGMPAAVQKIELNDAAVYWVYLPPSADRAQANRKLRELQAKGIDSFVVAGGADANAISLGSFTAKDSALGVQSRLISAGYAAEIREQRRDVEQTWVVLADPSAQGYLEFLPVDLRNRAKQQRLPCGGR